jgi:5'-3' exonuclease
MGIKFLNKFLKNECKHAIRETHLNHLNGKKIAVDINVYIFKYAMEETLIENIYMMCSLFRYYNIIPIFVFDGSSPAEKKELLKQRREKKYAAKKEFTLLKNKMTNEDLNSEDKIELQNQMDILKKQFVTITQDDFAIVKQLITAYGFETIDAPREADELCALLNIKGKVWGVLSEDMDMFVYGCTKVIRYFSILNHKCVVYDHKMILKTLKINQNELREICVVSGTDYNIENKYNLFTILKLFKKYKNRKITENFYNWLSSEIQIDDIDKLNSVFNMFVINESYKEDEELANYDKIKIQINSIDKVFIKELLKKDGFLFP